MKVPSHHQTFECTAPDGSWRHVWNISRAWQHGRTQTVVTKIMTAEDAAALAESGIRTNPQHVPDTEVPLLAVWFDDRAWLIDGWHRARRLHVGDEYKLVMLTRKQDLDSRICPCCNARTADIQRRYEAGERVTLQELMYVHGLSA